MSPLKTKPPKAALVGRQLRSHLTFAALFVKKKCKAKDNITLSRFFIVKYIRCYNNACLSGLNQCSPQNKKTPVSHSQREFPI